VVVKVENNNIRTMELIGVDDWSRPVYKCIENNILWKDVNLGSGQIELCSCGNEFDGEPDCPIKKDLEIHFVNNEEEQPTKEEKFNYMMLDRLRTDCEYYLGNGNRCKKHLWAGDEQEQINEMKKLYNSFADNKKPEWLTYDKILEYEKLIIK
jgi:hypothetical protein